LTPALTPSIINVPDITIGNKTVCLVIGGGERVFCNPPYGREIGKWVQKSFEESKKKNTLVVMLIPARTDTKYFHDYIYGKAEIRFIRGRLKFGNAKTAAPFPSMVVIFRSKEDSNVSHTHTGNA
jgi:hypothetical protein